MVKVPFESWVPQVWGDIRLDTTESNPLELSRSTAKLVNCICSCGRKTKIPFYRLTNGNTKSCGKCSFKSKNYWLEQKWGKLKLDPNQELPDEWAPNSTKKFEFICECGNHTKSQFSDISQGKSTNCGKCSWKPKEYWLEQKWGKLTLDSNQSLREVIPPATADTLLFNCECGENISIKFCDVTNGHSQSCGKCNRQSKEYWLAQKWGMLKLDPNQSLPESMGNGFGWVETCCDCGGRLTTKLANLVYQYTKSCGCIEVGENAFSPESIIRSFVLSLSSDTYPTSYPIEGTRRSYDIYIPSKKLAIEYHGLIWHSEKFNGYNVKGDYTKYLLAKSRGDRLIQIYSDEWRDKQEIIKEMLTSLITSPKETKI
jgi:predicted SprT family Zn-dependent metalloprotease